MEICKRCGKGRRIITDEFEEVWFVLCDDCQAELWGKVIGHDIEMEQKSKARPIQIHKR